MENLIKRIMNDASVPEDGILRVDTFLNHQLDPSLLKEIGKELAKRFKSAKPDKVLTAESSGIAVALFTALYLDVPAVFAKKFQTGYIDPDVWAVETHSFALDKSYTLRVSKKCLQEGERVLVVDDILSNGQSVLSLLELIATAGAEPVGVGIAIEKSNRDGGAVLRRMGIDVKSLVTFHGVEDDKIIVT